MAKFKAVILAAGNSTRMKSDVPKFLHEIAGKTLVEHVVDAAQAAGGEVCVVVGNRAEDVKETLSGRGVRFFTQTEPLGTGHAVMAAAEFFADYTGTVIALFGADPLITEDTISALVELHEKESNAFTVVSAMVGDPLAYGRIVRENGKFSKIVEHKDATPEQRQIKEINTGVCAFSGAALNNALSQLSNDNSQKEYYLTKVPEIMMRQGLRGGLMVADSYEEFQGVDTRADLAAAMKIMRKRINGKHMINGVTLIDPDITYIDCGVQIGQDTVVWPNTHIQGKTVIGRQCVIKGGRLTDMTLRDKIEFENSVAVESEIGSGTRVGPFAYIRPGSRLGENVKVGDFVEIKNSTVGNGSSVAHLAYVGDCDMGEKVNFGCGAITVNYDGKRKYRTTISDKAFVGSNSNLVAPVVVGEGAFVAAGSTITDDVPECTLCIARSRQMVKKDWKDKRDE